MSEIDLEPLRRLQIERELDRPLPEDALRVVRSVDALSDSHREVIRRLGPSPLGVLYLGAVIPGIRDAAHIADRIANGKNWITVSAWQNEAGLGRWRFRIPRINDETAAETVRRSVDIIVSNAAPFGRVQSVSSREVPAELVFDVSVETEEGPRVLQAVAAVTFAIVDGEVELVFLLDVDIHAYVTLRHIDNAKLAAVNAPRLEQFLGVLREHLRARLIESNGLLPANDTGFTAR